MAYTASSDIQNEFKSITFSASTAVTSTQVDGFIAQEEAILNGMLAPVYTVPITGTASLLIVKAIAILMVKARIVDLLAVKTGGKTPDQGDPEAKQLYDKAMELIKKILNKEILLSDAALASTGGTVRSYNYENSVEPTFSRDKTQW